MEGLPSRQRAVLEFIQQHLLEKGYPPSVREIGQAVGLASSSTVHGHLQRLQAKGYLRIDPTKPRAIEVVRDFQQTEPRGTEAVVWAPLLGQVPAGTPKAAMEHIEEYFPLPKSMVRHDEVFLLRVQGESMVEVGILDGDLVIVRKQASAQNGDIVVAMTRNNEATVKRFFKENGEIRLQPENSSMKPIRLREVTLLGKVIGIFRTFD